LDDDEAAWWAKEMEAESTDDSNDQLSRYGELLLLSQAFDEYVHKKLRFVKR
jgi:hypothetical protein